MWKKKLKRKVRDHEVLCRWCWSTKLEIALLCPVCGMTQVDQPIKVALLEPMHDDTWRLAHETNKIDTMFWHVNVRMKDQGYIFPEGWKIVIFDPNFSQQPGYLQGNFCYTVSYLDDPWPISKLSQAFKLYGPKE